METPQLNRKNYRAILRRLGLSLITERFIYYIVVTISGRKMGNKKSNLLRNIAITATAVVIGTPLGVALMQPYSYCDTQSRLARMERENPAVAQEFAETLASSNKSIVADLVSYGTQKAAREYLSR